MANIQLFELYPKFQGVRLSMVADVGQQTFGQGKTSNDVSTPLDRSLLMHLRKQSNFAVTDTATATAEGYKQSKFVEIEAWTKTANSRGLKDQPAAGELHAFTVVHVEDIRTRLNQLLLEHKSILLETGITLSTELATQSLIDEACITITTAQHESLALNALEIMQSKIGLEYLPQKSHIWLEQTLFARLHR